MVAGFPHLTHTRAGGWDKISSKAKDEGLFQGDQFQVQLHSKAQDSVRIGDCEPKGSAVILILLTALSVELQLKIWP